MAPDYENEKIKEMELFGWNLQNRQEIHEEGEAYGRPSYLSNSSYIVETKVSHYVKLHFIRNLNHPNLDKIKPIESEYFSLPFPTYPSLKWPMILTILPILSGLLDVSRRGDQRPFWIGYGGSPWLSLAKPTTKEAEHDQ